MSEQPADNHQQQAPPAAPPAAGLEEPAAFEKILAVLGVIAGIGLIIMSLDMATGGRLFGYAQPEE